MSVTSGPPVQAAASLFAGVHPVVHLPLTDRGAFDEAGVTAQVEHLLDHGATGIVTVGLATESWTLSEAERELLVRSCVDAVAGRRPVTVGLDGDTLMALRRGARAVELGAAALMVRPPGGLPLLALQRHVDALARELPVPLVVQDAPAATGVDLPVAVLTAMTEGMADRAAVKVELPVGSAAKIRQLADAGLVVVAGWGGVGYLEAVLAGAVGCMPGSDLAAAFVRIDRLARSGDAADAVAAVAEYGAIEPLLLAQSTSLELLVVSAKRALARRGVLASARSRIDASAVPPADLRHIDLLGEALHGRGVAGW
jgi:4-hydroxy-tetrahydrodipicolinate synthase